MENSILRNTMIFMSLTTLFILIKVSKSFQNSNDTFLSEIALKSEVDEENQNKMIEIHASHQTSSEFLINQEFVGMKNEAGRINTIVVDRSDSNHIIVGANSGGLWKSFNRGKSWSPINDFANTLKVTCIVQSPLKSNEYYYSTGTNYYDNGVLLNDIYKSTDGGNTFEPIIFNSNNKFGNIEKIVCSPIDSNVVYFSNFYSPIVANQFGALYKTTDNFKTFTKVYNAKVNDFQVLNNGNVVLSSSNSIYTSNSGNLNTFVKSTGINSTVSAMQIGVCKNQPNFMYSRAYDGGKSTLYKSINSGITWVLIDTLIGSLGDGDIIIHPNNPNFVIVGFSIVSYTRDGGQTWKYEQIGNDVRDFYLDPTLPGTLFIASDWGLNSTKIDPFTNASINSDFAISYDSTLLVQEIYHGDYRYKGNENLVGLQDLGIHKIFNDRSNYKIDGADGIMTFYHRQDTSIAYFTPQTGILRRSNNIQIKSPTFIRIANQLDTNNNFNIDEGSSFFHPFSINYQNGNQLFFPTQKRLWRSNDSGNNWEPITDFYNGSFGNFYSTITNDADPTVYWSIHDSIYAKTNAATTKFNHKTIKVPYRVSKLFADPNNKNGVFYFNDQKPTKIYYTADFFATNIVWKDLNFPSEITPRTLTTWPTNSKILFVGALEGGIYISADGGSTWAKETKFPNVQVNDIKIRPSDGKVFIFTFGRGSWTADFALPTSTKTIENQIDINIYPNPTYNNLNISSSQNLKTVDIIITDILGKNIKKLRTTIDNILKIDVSDLNSGLHILTIWDGNRRLADKKFMKL